METPRINPNPPLTRQIVQSGVLRETPFCLVDVGASGGTDGYWDVFGEDLRAFGFDGLVKEVERLNAEERTKGRRYYSYLVGDKSYETPTGVPNTQPFQRTSAARASEVTKKNYAATYFDRTGACVYTDEMIELDSFFLRDNPADVDFIKIDTDGSDYQVLLGAKELISKGPVLGIGIESQFHGLVHDQSNTFRNIDRLLTGWGYSLFDLEVHRYTRASLPGRFCYRIPAQTTRGQVLWGEALYLRDAGMKGYETDWAIQLSIPKILKLLCLFEIFGLEDCGAELLLKYRANLAGRLDVDACLDMLTPEVNGAKVSYERYVELFEQDPSSFYPNG